MKKLLYLLVVLIMSFLSIRHVQAQDVNFIDPNFKAALVGNPAINGNGDGEIQVSEAQSFGGLIDVQGIGITDLTGIEAFINITTLNCVGNQLTDLNVSANTALTNLFCGGNQLTSIDLSANTSLAHLNCDNNQLSTLDVSSNTALISLVCRSNQLSTINVSTNTALQSLVCGDNHLSTLNVAACTSLTTLNCSHNQLTALDVSLNTALTSLGCSVNQLTALNLSTNTALTELTCTYNQISSLNVSANTALIGFDCTSNQLSSLDISANTSLGFLGCSLNQLTALDVSANTQLTALACEENQLTSLNLLSNTWLTSLVCTKNQLTALDVSANTSLSYLDCRFNTITGLNVSNNTALSILTCDNNQITSLNLSANSALSNLDCSHNQLTSLNLKNGNNANMYFMQCGFNPPLTCIQVDDATYMNANWSNAKDATASFSTNCTAPPCIVYIPDANFKAALVANTAINTNNDGEIQCTEAAAYTGTINVGNRSITDLTGINSFTGMTNLDCSSNNLSSLNISANTALTELYCGSNLLSNLELSANTALLTLECSFNNLSTLDVSANTALTTLYCSNNGLSTLNVSGCTALTTLRCFQNQLAHLDLSSNRALVILKCQDNTLISLDVSANPNISELDCSFNQLSSLNVSAHPFLSAIYCYSNALTSLDLSTNPYLTNILCANNQLTTLNIKNGHSSNISFFAAYNNPSLTCIQVDDVNYMNNNWSAGKDATASFSTNCSACTPTSSSTSVRACSPYNWNGTSYTSSGTYTYLTTNAGGCDSTVTLHLTIVDPSPKPSRPAISGPTYVCPYIGSGTATYFVTPIPANVLKYSWTLPPNVTIVSGTVESPSITVSFTSGFVSNTNKTIKVKAIGCSGNSLDKSLKLSVIIKPVISGNAMPCPSTTEVYTATAPAGSTYTYMWTVPRKATIIGSSTGSSITVSFSSTFSSGRITAKAVSECGTNSTKSLSVEKCTPLARPSSIATTVSAAAKLNVSIYPNPSNGDFNISVDGAVNKVNTDAIVEIVNEYGQVVYHKTVKNKNDIIPVKIKGSIANGLYMVHYIINGETITRKIVINR